jgi:hypothetical protein
MRDNRLHLVEPERSAKASTDAPTELSETGTSPDVLMGRLRLVHADGEAPPDNAA